MSRRTFAILSLLVACGSGEDPAPVRDTPMGVPADDAGHSPQALPPAVGDAVEIYPPPPLGQPSRAFRVAVGGRPAYVEHYGDVSYVRFAFRGSVDVDVTGDVGQPRIVPAPRVASQVVVGSTLRLRLTEPESFVVSSAGREKLFVLPDPIEVAPAVGDPGVVSVADFPTPQAAIDAMATRQNGGVVLFPPGLWVTGTLSVKTNVTLYLAAGALLRGSFDPGDYPVDPGRVETGTDATLPPDPRYFGRTMTFTRLLLVDRAHHVSIRGRGTIDGSGSFLRKQHGAVPNLVRVRESQHVTIEDVLLRNAAAWTVHVVGSDAVDLRRVKLVNDRTNLNTDGIDPDMSTNVTVDRAFVYTKDDAICLKATRNGDIVGDVANVTVKRSVVSSMDAALKLGTESFASSFKAVTFEDDWVFESGRAMSIVVRDGASYEDVTFRGIHVEGVDHLVEQVIGVRDPHRDLGRVRRLSFVDIDVPSYTLPSSHWTWYAQFRPSAPKEGAPDVNVFEGADPEQGVAGLRFANVVVNGHPLRSADDAVTYAGMTIGPNVSGVTFE